MSIRVVSIFPGFVIYYCKMTEPYPSTEVESKLKHLFRSLTRARRAYKDTRNHALTLLHRASAAVLTAVLVYKALTYLLFLPAMNGIWSLTLRCSPVNYLTNNNAHQIFTSPTILGGIVLIVLLAAFWNLYGFSILLHGFALACRGETLRPVSLFVRSLGDIRHVLLPKNWPILLYCALLIPFTDVFVTYNYISQLAVPEYILGLVRAKPLYLVLFLLILGAAFLFTLFWVLVLPLFTLERKSLWEAVQESAAHVKTQLPRLAGVLLRWNLSALVRSVLVFFGASLLVYSVAALIGLRSTRAMLLLARALYLLEIPFFGFLLDCKVTTAQCTIIAFLYDRFRDCPPEELPEGKPHRFGGWPLLTAAVAGVTLVTGLTAVYLYALPQDDALLTAVGGVTPLVTFHRGDCTVAPENTLPAFRSAILKGGDRIELDVQMTSDGVVVVTHDSNLKRCTGKNAKVYDLTYAEVAQLDAGRWFSSRFADTRIPTLEQVLQLCRGRIGLNVEIKPSAATPALEAETVRLLREYGFDSSNCVITSQSYETLHKVKALAPEYPTGYILALGVGNYYDLPDADFFSVETTFITSGMVNAVHLRGKTVSAWTIDREKVATHMLELGVDDLITDKPDMVQDLLARNQQVDDSLIDFRDLLNALLHPEQPADSSDDAEETITDAVEDPEEFVDAA